MEIDFTDQIKQMQADEEAGYPPNCNEGYEEKDGKCVEIVGYWKKKTMAEKNYPGKNVKRRKDGVPKKKMKKRACKPGEYRAKSGNLKKAKGEASTPQPPHKDISDHNLEDNPNLNKDVVVEETEIKPTPETKPLRNPVNMHEYYKNLYRKVKGLD